MKTFCVIATVMAFLAFAASTAFAEMDHEAFKAIVEEMFAVYASANVNGDADTWGSLWDENGVKMVPNKPAILGKATIVEMKRKGFQKVGYESQLIRVEDVQVAGDWGFARGTGRTVKKPKGGTAASVDGKFMTIFKKQADGSWKIYWDCMNVDAPK